MIVAWLALAILGAEASPLGSELPQWVKVLNPHSSARIRWIERFENDYDSSGLNLRLRAGSFPKLHPKLSAGFELSTRASQSIEVPLGDKMGNKDIGLSQAYVRFQDGGISLAFGKFESPTMTSPLIFREELFPEGAFESVQFEWAHGDITIAPYAAQYSLDQQAASSFQGLRQERSWLFQQGLHFKYSFTADADFLLALNSYYFLDPSDELANLSAQMGNSFTGSVNSNARFESRFFPLEAVIQVKGNPLGLTASGLLAGAINFRSADNHRSLFAELSLGNEWKASKVLVKLAYFYHEPDTTIAYFAEESLGFTNRHGARGQIAYYPLSFLKVAASYVFATVVAESPMQNKRHEGRFESEVKF